MASGRRGRRFKSCHPEQVEHRCRAHAWDAILSIVRKWLDLRAIWRWTVRDVGPAFLGWGVVAAVVTLASHHFESRYWVRWAIGCVIFTAGFSLMRLLRPRRNTMRTLGKD
jgi:hypothetical protein